MRVLITGGGLAGMTLGYWLQRYGSEPVIIEQADELRRDGYAIDFFGAGYDTAARMGLIASLKEQAIPLEAISYVNRAGRPIASINGALLARITGDKYLGLMHATLEETLFAALAGRVEVRFGRALTAVSASDERVEVTLSDGATEAIDLLIGADGLHSRTRELVFGPEEQFRRFLGYMVACYPLADRYGIGRAWKMYQTPGRMVGAYPSRRAGEIVTLFMYHAAEPERVAAGERLARLRELFAGVEWITPRLLADAEETQRFFLDAVSQVSMPVWSRGRVCLVGDACACPTLISGQGASLAMGGAYLLARALGESGSWREAFQRYEQWMRPPVERAQRHARSLAASFAPATRAGVLAARVLLPIVMRDAFAGLLRREFSAESFLPPA